MHASFLDSLSSEPSSLLTDSDTMPSRSDPVPLHSTPQSADKMVSRPTPSPGDTSAGEVTESYYDDYFPPCESAEEFMPFVELGRNSGESRHRDHWVNPPVSYVPSSWPTGPRNLPPNHYVCPYKGCEHPLGPKDSDEGYNRETLGLHIQSHPVKNSVFGPLHLKWTVRARLEAMRRALHPNPDDITEDDDELGYDSHDPKGSQRETDQLIQDLEEIRYWEWYIRSGWAFQNRPMRNNGRMRHTYIQREQKGRAVVDAAEDADDESVPHQNSNRFRNNRFRRQRNPFYDNIKQLEEDSSALYLNFIATMQSTQEKAMAMYSTQEKATDSDSSFGPPRKKARKSRSQLDVSYDDLFPQTG